MLRAASLLTLLLLALVLRATAADSESELIQRRTARVAELPPAPSPPAAQSPGSSPIDAFITARLIQAGLEKPSQPPQLCDDATFARRAYLDLVGVIPNFVELNRFLTDSAANKREKLVDALLARNADYAAHWTSFWEDALASQTVLSQGGIPTRGNYRDWIYQSFERNRPFDVLVAELIDPTMPRRQGAATQDILGTKHSIEYVRNEDLTVTLQTAANIGQVLLGTAMKCASCHDHFENREWTQARFLGFAGLFAPQNLELVRCETHSGQHVPAAFPFDFPAARTAVPSDLPARLHLAAQLVTDPANPRFARTIVNRLWKRYLGWGLVEPADDFRSDVPASHPELLDYLADDFLRHGCDLKHSIRLIATSQTYGRKYDPAVEDRVDPANRALPRYFRSPALRRLTAEQFLDSIRLITTNKLEPGERSYLDARSTALTRALGRPASRNEIITSRPDDVAVVQGLELLNGTELHELLYQTPLATDTQVKADARRVIDKLYRTALSRPATVEEKRLGREFLMSSGALNERLGDLLWALVCSPEFQYIK